MKKVTIIGALLLLATAAGAAPATAQPDTAPAVPTGGVVTVAEFQSYVAACIPTPVSLVLCDAWSQRINAAAPAPTPTKPEAGARVSPTK